MPPLQSVAPSLPGMRTSLLPPKVRVTRSSPLSSFRVARVDADVAHGQVAHTHATRADDSRADVAHDATGRAEGIAHAQFTAKVVASRLLIARSPLSHVLRLSALLASRPPVLPIT
jgi:hypothetical protein